MKKRTFSGTGSTTSEASSEDSENFLNGQNSQPKHSLFGASVNPSTPLRAFGGRPPSSDDAFKLLQQYLRTPPSQKASPNVSDSKKPGVAIKSDAELPSPLSFDGSSVSAPAPTFDMQTQYLFDENKLNDRHLDAKEEFASYGCLDFDRSDSGYQSLIGSSSGDSPFLDSFELML